MFIHYSGKKQGIRRHWIFVFPKMIHDLLINCQDIPHRRSEKFKDIKAAYLPHVWFLLPFLHNLRNELFYRNTFIRVVGQHFLRARRSYLCAVKFIGLKRIKRSILSNSTLQSSFSILLSNDNLIFCLSNLATTWFSIFLMGEGSPWKASQGVCILGCNHCLWVMKQCDFCPWNSLYKYKVIY